LNAQILSPGGARTIAHVMSSIQDSIPIVVLNSGLRFGRIRGLRCTLGSGYFTLSAWGVDADSA
jgi:hypothetical protein